MYPGVFGLLLHGEHTDCAVDLILPAVFVLLVPVPVQYEYSPREDLSGLVWISQCGTL